MPTIDHDRDCVCGQPLDLIVASTSLHCPRCGRVLTSTCPSEGDRESWVLSPVMAAAAT